MKTYRLKSAAAVQENSTNLYEDFVNYLESVYFEGAAELLDQELICFEYNAFMLAS